MILDVTELPPRARRIPNIRGLAFDIHRNYLRVRGEYAWRMAPPHTTLELPPRARRIRARARRNTPANRNYLRVRGEYFVTLATSTGCGELPPRARRIRSFGLPLRNLSGTTSACAENTFQHQHDAPRCGNYLRVRGEYKWASGPSLRNSELPPRARRIPHHGWCSAAHNGTTSACAENTIFHRVGRGQSRNYLRVRGEYPRHCITDIKKMELPPRARRIPHYPPPPGHCPGTTSACAENTVNQHQEWEASGNYLRVRGEYGRFLQGDFP